MGIAMMLYNTSYSRIVSTLQITNLAFPHSSAQRLAVLKKIDHSV